eukprot:4606219-Pyramimonas_sp.AAC.1
MQRIEGTLTAGGLSHHPHHPPSSPIDVEIYSPAYSPPATDTKPGRPRLTLCRRSHRLLAVSRSALAISAHARA